MIGGIVSEKADPQSVWKIVDNWVDEIHSRKYIIVSLKSGNWKMLSMYEMLAKYRYVLEKSE